MKKSTSIILLIILIFSINIKAQENKDLTKLLNTKNTEFYQLLGMLGNCSGRLVFIET